MGARAGALAPPGRVVGARERAGTGAPAPASGVTEVTAPEEAVLAPGLSEVAQGSRRGVAQLCKGMLHGAVTGYMHAFGNHTKKA